MFCFKMDSLRAEQEDAIRVDMEECERGLMDIGVVRPRLVAYLKEHDTNKFIAEQVSRYRVLRDREREREERY